MKLYLINIYEAQMAAEEGITAVMNPTDDTQYYKSEVLEEAEVELPEGFSVKNTVGGGEWIFKGIEDASMVTDMQDDKYVTSLVTSEGIVTLHTWNYK